MQQLSLLDWLSETWARERSCCWNLGSGRVGQQLSYAEGTFDAVWVVVTKAFVWKSNLSCNLTYTLQCWGISSLSSSSTEALAGIWFIYYLFYVLWERPESDLKICDINALFTCSQVHVTDPICATREEKIGMGSLKPRSVTQAIVIFITQRGVRKIYTSIRSTAFTMTCLKSTKPA